MDPGERLQKLLAGAGLGSRRTIEGWIAEGRVTVNGQVATLGTRGASDDDIRLDGRPVRLTPDPMRVLLYHKPEGRLVTERDPAGRPTALEQLPAIRGARWIAVGRLDLNTSGLLLFTTHGELAHRLMHPRFQIERAYLARVRGTVSAEGLAKLTSGVMLDGTLACFERVVAREAGSEGINRWYEVVVREGRYREVRRLFEAVGVEVNRLIRVGFGPLELPRGLRPGASVLVTGHALSQLLASVRLEGAGGGPPSRRERSSGTPRKRR